jgi:hypothetical protein
MSGIVERLRGLKTSCSNDDCEVCCIATEAADTIKALCEALRATTHELDAMLRCISDRQTHAEMSAIADKAREALAKAKS